MASLTGKTFLITGVTATPVGIGFEIAKALGLRGANVAITSRTSDKGKASKDALVSAGVPEAAVHPFELELHKPESITALVEKYSSSGLGLNGIAANAGVWPREWTFTDDGQELGMATNVLGHHRLFTGLLPLLESADDARILITSSGLAKNGKPEVVKDPTYKEARKGAFDHTQAYSNTKLLNIYQALELAERVKEKGIKVHSSHPGFVATGLGRSFPFPIRMLMGVVKLFIPGPDSGAISTVQGLTAPEFGEETGLWIGKDGKAATLAGPGLDEEARKAAWKWIVETTGQDV